jgi:type VI secretion system Hcp family effector
MKGMSELRLMGQWSLQKNVDKASPLLAMALSKREELNCIIHFYRISQFGQHQKYYTVDLRGCIIADLSLDVPHAVLMHDIDAQEHPSIRYREIIWTHHLAGTSGYSSWPETDL